HPLFPLKFITSSLKFPPHNRTYNKNNYTFSTTTPFTPFLSHQHIFLYLLFLSPFIQTISPLNTIN
ncbi:hypothetical protein, partial [Bacillus altitudinis]|uniref:hypothetical protein n=1 Tax=Bacillus altitudinis TaxID=293387 RepID=UPI001C92DF58